MTLNIGQSVDMSRISHHPEDNSITVNMLDESSCTSKLSTATRLKVVNSRSRHNIDKADLTDERPSA